MNGTENKMTYQGNSTAKSWLTGIFSFLVALNVIGLIGAVASSSGSRIGLTLIHLVFAGIMLTAIIKQWRVVLKIGRIVIVIGMVFAVIALVLETIAFTAEGITEDQRNLMIVNQVILCVALIGNGFLVKLIGRYTAELERDSYA